MKSVILFVAVLALTSLTTGIETCPKWTTFSETMYSVCLSSKTYSWDMGMKYCYQDMVGSHLCTLKELAALYELGARDNHWGLTNGHDRDARMSPCGDYKGAECYNNGAPEPYFPNTPRPNSWDEVYCCKSWK
ncbi:uncharacterized protein LOC119738026 [Patiria miniata]|uniref:Uncharacterized protein n=1 Tax=Patiria miniata TaxID=46514 RepID=A0A914AX18_PATMI|nr:uncharacterized protein LOC119738026 [Patiria miniata]